MRAGLAVLVAVAALGAAAVLAWPSRERAGETVLIEIPAGTGARLARHERVDVIPARLVVDAGDRLRIVNHDSRSHLVGPFYVGAREAMQTRLVRPGRYEGTCTVHRGKRVEIVVRAT